MIKFFGELKKKVDVAYAEVRGGTTHLCRRLEARADEVIFGVDPECAQNIMEEMRGTTSSSGRKRWTMTAKSWMRWARLNTLAW